MEMLLHTLQKSKIKAVPYESPEMSLYHKLKKELQLRSHAFAQSRERLSSLITSFQNEARPFYQAMADTIFNNLVTLDQHFKTKKIPPAIRDDIRDFILEKSRQLLDQFHDPRGQDFYDYYLLWGQAEKSPEDFSEQSFFQEEDFKQKSQDHESSQHHFAGASDEEEEDYAPHAKSPDEIDFAGDCRELYHLLVKTLHPDRERDENKKIDKTELLKNITVAYEKQDLMTLVKFYEKYLNPDQNSFSEYMKKNIAILTKNLEIELMELQYAEKSFRRDSMYQNFYAKTDKTAKKKIDAYLRQLDDISYEEKSFGQKIKTLSGLKRFFSPQRFDSLF